jgi:hydrogenase maturation protease
MKTLVAGIGSTILGDDGVGVVAARKLKDILDPGQADILELGTGGLALLDYLEGYDRLIVLDAVVSGAAPGTVFEYGEEATAATVHLGGGHEADLPAVLSLGRKLARQMPEDVIVIAVEAANITQFSEMLTPAVEAAIPEVLQRVRRRISVR